MTNTPQDAAVVGLRAANIARQIEWDKDDGIDAAYRGNELAGEVGEACNVIKKLERERRGIRGSRATVEDLADELADVVICTDLIAMQYDIDLDAAVERKFNATSEKVGLQTRLKLDGFGAASVIRAQAAEIEALTRTPSPVPADAETPAWADERACAQEEADTLASRATDWEIIAGSWKARAERAEAERDTLREALTASEPMLETLHSIVTARNPFRSDKAAADEWAHDYAKAKREASQ